MQHRIETNVTPKNFVEIDMVRTVIARKVDKEVMDNLGPTGDSIQVTWPTGSNVVVTIRGNGALLRDACFALDVAGMLD